MGIAEATRSLDRGDPPFGMAPIGRFLQVYNRQLSDAKPTMEEWWVFGGFLDELPNEDERRNAEAMLRQLAAASADCFDRVCSEVEALAAPAWHRRMRVQMAANLDELQFDQTGARLAALAAIAELLGWDTGADTRATGFGTRRTNWRFSPRGDAQSLTLSVRVGGPRLFSALADPVDLEFALTPDDHASSVVRAAFRRLAELTVPASQSATLIDLPLRRRLEMLRRALTVPMRLGPCSPATVGPPDGA